MPSRLVGARASLTRDRLASDDSVNPVSLGRRDNVV
jgi:hypothetical protein